MLLCRCQAYSYHQAALIYTLPVPGQTGSTAEGRYESCKTCQVWPGGVEAVSLHHAGAQGVSQACI